MAIFDQIIGGISSEDPKHAALYSEVGQLVAQAGGVSGLEQQFQQKGLGGIIANWIGSGPNPPISGQQVASVVGDDKIAEIASKVGLSEDQVKSGVSKLLPLMVDHMTPNGTAAGQSANDVQGMLGSLRSKLGI